jgi:hypothetical protein
MRSLQVTERQYLTVSHGGDELNLDFDWIIWLVLEIPTLFFFYRFEPWN